MYQLQHAHVEGTMATRLVRCDYEGCIDGIVHCCDGVQENVGMQYKACKWCGELVNPEDCFCSVKNGKWLCQICSKEVSHL